MSEKGLPARAIYGFDGTNWVKVKVDADGKVYITNTDLTTILSKIQNATYGLEALKDLINVLTAYVDTEISAIKSKTDNLPSNPASQTKVDDIDDLLNNEAYGLVGLDLEIEEAVSLLGLLDESLETHDTDIKGELVRKIQHMDFWADNKASVVLTTVGTADYALNSLTVAGIPSGATLVRVVAVLKIAAIRDTSTLDNAVNGATALKVDADVAYGSLVTAIDIEDNSWAILIANGADRGGDILFGDNDVKTEISGNGTYYARLENIACDGNNLTLLDVTWGVRIYFY